MSEIVKNDEKVVEEKKNSVLDIPDVIKEKTTSEKFKDFSMAYANNMRDLKRNIEALASYYKRDDYNEICKIYEDNAEAIEQVSKAFALFPDSFVENNNDNNVSNNNNNNNIDNNKKILDDKKDTNNQKEVEENKK